MTDEEFARAFEDLTLPNSAFHHRDHVRLAWIYLRRHPALEALARFTEGLRRFAAFHGHPGLYHETITWAYVLLVQERRQDGARDWPAFAAANPDLMAWKPSLLEDRYYRTETLWSERARRAFVWPDRVGMGA